MQQPEIIPPGQGVSLNVKVSPGSHNRLKRLRSALAYQQSKDLNLTDIYQLTVEAGIEALEKQMRLQPA